MEKGVPMEMLREPLRMRLAENIDQLKRLETEKAREMKVIEHRAHEQVGNRHGRRRQAKLVRQAEARIIKRLKELT